MLQIWCSRCLSVLVFSMKLQFNGKFPFESKKKERSRITLNKSDIVYHFKIVATSRCHLRLFDLYTDTRRHSKKKSNSDFVKKSCVALGFFLISTSILAERLCYIASNAMSMRKFTTAPIGAALSALISVFIRYRWRCQASCARSHRKWDNYFDMYITLLNGFGGTVWSRFYPRSDAKSNNNKQRSARYARQTGIILCIIDNFLLLTKLPIIVICNINFYCLFCVGCDDFHACSSIHFYEYRTVQK